jgi:hypothetical protein
LTLGLVQSNCALVHGCKTQVLSFFLFLLKVQSELGQRQSNDSWLGLCSHLCSVVYKLYLTSLPTLLTLVFSLTLSPSLTLSLIRSSWWRCTKTWEKNSIVMNDHRYNQNHPEMSD